MIERIVFATEDVGSTLTELGCSQIGANARFLFDSPIVVTLETEIDYDSRHGVFYLVRHDQSLELMSGKWDR